MRARNGFTLIEVLITLLVITSGLLAYVAMQRGVFREANLSTGRVAATELAMAKLEDLRSFTALKTTTGLFAYQDIASNVGGSLPSGTVVVDNISFNRSWTASNYWYPGSNSAAVTTAPTGNPLPSYKLVTVTITWIDQNGESPSLALTGIVAAMDPARVSTIFN
jgi:type IV pilus assembly protein PilV